MNTPIPRQFPRFVPTLTEVVRLPDGAVPAEESPTDPRPAIMASVLQRVSTRLDERLAVEVEPMIRALVIDQMQRLHMQLHQELESMVQQAVAELRPTPDIPPGVDK